MRHNPCFTELAAAALALSLAGMPALAQEDPKDIIAAQVRSQGFECKTPQSAEADKPDSHPDGEAWILKCDNATYRVKLIPDMAADIEKIE
jgi:hypothetical protein